MKPYIKALLFLGILSILEIFLKQGLIAFIVPLPLPPLYSALFLFTLFTGLAILVTQWASKKDNTTLADFGVSINSKNRMEFYVGLFVGLLLWGLISILQSKIAGFSWIFRPDKSLFNVLYGLIFIFIADLGTELFYRGYALTRLEDSFGSHIAIMIMALFVGIKSFSFIARGELLFFTMLIPLIHTIFFSIIYFKTRRFGAPLGIHTGANFITISIFDLRESNPNHTIPSGIFQPDVTIENLSMTSLQFPWVIITMLFSVTVYYWWKKDNLKIDA